VCILQVHLRWTPYGRDSAVVGAGNTSRNKIKTPALLELMV
jgi:hypothetical protein